VNSSTESYQGLAISFLRDEDGAFTAEVPAIRGCVAWGRSLEEAYRNAVDATESCLEARTIVSQKKPRKTTI
jgi:predicted RNase H-like HicB family nuclease